MIGRRYIRTRQLQPGMKMDQSVVDRLGRNLVVRGTIIDEYIIESFQKRERPHFPCTKYL